MISDGNNGFFMGGVDGRFDHINASGVRYSG